MSSAASSPESAYYSLPDDASVEEEEPKTAKPRLLDLATVEPGILSSIVAHLGSSEGTVPTVMPDVRMLLCLNAARMMLVQVGAANAPAEVVNSFKGPRLLNLILAICAEWKGPNLDIRELLALPFFDATMEEAEHERLRCSLEAFKVLVQGLSERPSVAVISGENDTISVLSLCDGRVDLFIVFNPRCRQSPDMTGMSFRLFKDQDSVAQHIHNLLSIYKNTLSSHAPAVSISSVSSGSSGPSTSPPIHNMYTAHLFVPIGRKAHNGLDISLDELSIDQKVTFQSNMALLKHNVELNNINSSIQNSKREFERLQQSLAIEEERERKERESIMTHQQLIEEAEAEIQNFETIAATMLEGGVHLYGSKGRKSMDENNRGKQEEPQLDGIYPWSYVGRRAGVDSPPRASSKGKRRDSGERRDGQGDVHMRDDSAGGSYIAYQPLNSDVTSVKGKKARNSPKQSTSPYSYGAAVGYSSAQETIEKWRRQTDDRAGDIELDEYISNAKGTYSAAADLKESRSREKHGKDGSEQYRDGRARDARRKPEEQAEERLVSYDLHTQITDDDEASRLLAMSLMEEEERALMEFQRLQETFKTFDCPICAETFEQGDAAQAERCGHVVCRGCMLGHIKAQIEQAHWPIFCGMCTNDLPNRGVVTRRVAELVGGNEELFRSWNRMELGGVSIVLECPRCRESTRVDAEDFREAELLDCPLGCGAHWCKECHQEVERGKKHSCDGQEEMDNLAKEKGWKRCPGCATYAEKVDGCNQLSCKTPGCNMHFCYICGGKIAQTASTQEMVTAKMQHYETCKLW